MRGKLGCARSIDRPARIVAYDLSFGITCTGQVALSVVFRANASVTHASREARMADTRETVLRRNRVAIELSFVERETDLLVAGTNRAANFHAR